VWGGHFLSAALDLEYALPGDLWSVASRLIPQRLAKQKARLLSRAF
jgi:hypothetical protein